jgi:hypothetical protein
VRHDLLEGNRWGGRCSPWRVGGGSSSWNPTSPVVGNNEGGHGNEDTWHRGGGAQQEEPSAGKEKSMKGVLGAFYGRWHRAEGRGVRLWWRRVEEGKGSLVQRTLELEGAGDNGPGTTSSGGARVR